MTDTLTLTFSALADPTRRAILQRLAEKDCTVKELARPFDLSLPAVSKHLKVLEHAGLIAKGKDAQYRPCSLRPRRLQEAGDWVQQYRRFWEESLDRLDEYLAQVQSAAQPASQAVATPPDVPHPSSEQTDVRPTSEPRGDRPRPSLDDRRGA